MRRSSANSHVQRLLDRPLSRTMTTGGALGLRMMEAFDLYSPEIDADPFP
jgi:hypothetical protein